MIELPTEFRADLESFRGPLDLLLYLIRKEEIEIVEIPIARITNQYLAFLEILKQIDPNACGEFLVMSANLMEIKSKMLLPEVPAEEGEEEELEDPRLELVLQLLEYKKYKERALILERMVHDHGLRFERPEEDVPDLDRTPMPMSLGKVSIWDLLTAFQRVQMALESRQPHRILYEDRPIEEYIAAVEERLDGMSDTNLPFESLFELCKDRYELLGFFLAVLEMARRGRILLDQPSAFGAIRISLRIDRPARIQAEEEMSAASPEAGSRLEMLGAGTAIETAPPSADAPDLDTDPATSDVALPGSAALGADGEASAETSVESPERPGPARLAVDEDLEEDDDELDDDEDDDDEDDDEEDELDDEDLLDDDDELEEDDDDDEEDDDDDEEDDDDLPDEKNTEN